MNQSQRGTHAEAGSDLRLERYAHYSAASNLLAVVPLQNVEKLAGGASTNRKMSA
jgi:hypothetical protein